MKKIKVLLADDNENTRTSIRQLLELDHSIDIVAEARNGQEVIEKVKNLEPEIAIMDISMPVMDGIEATRYLSAHHPGIMVIIISVSDDVKNLRKAMLAGAKEYLVKPLSPAELNSTVRKIAELNRSMSNLPDKEGSPAGPVSVPKDNKIISVFGTKGGVGKSVICTNLAVAMAQNSGSDVGLVDLDIQFGDISVMMNINPRKTISELMQEGEYLNRDVLEDYIYERNRVNILPAPNKPELAELVTVDGIKKVLNIYREMFAYTFIDTPSFIDDITLTALEVSDVILLIVTLDLPTIKNVKKGIDILQTLKLMPKTNLILNRSSGIAGIEPRDVENVLDIKIKAEVPSDGRLVISSVNQGIPFVKMNPRAPVSRGIFSILKTL